jgi:hypothetical protein
MKLLSDFQSADDKDFNQPEKRRVKDDKAATVPVTTDFLAHLGSINAGSGDISADIEAA